MDYSEEFLNGYHAGARDIADGLEKIIHSSATDKEFIKKVMALALGTKVLLAGGTSEEAETLVDIMMSV